MLAPSAFFTPSRSVPLRLYQAVTALSGPILKILLEKRNKAGKEIPERLLEKQGIPGQPRPKGALIWLHGASVGESLSMLPLIQRLQTQFPDRPILVTTGTRTSAELMAKRLPPGVIHQFYPLDHPAWAKKFLDHWQPSHVLWFESELWPNMLSHLQKRRIPTILLNARMSDRSFAKWQKWPQTIAAILSGFQQILAQSQDDYQHFTALTNQKIDMLGNLKYAAGDLPADAETLADLRHVIGQRPVWCAASTHPGEEEQMLIAHQLVCEKHPDCLLILVPRHPERGAKLEETLDTDLIGPLARRSDGQNLTRDTAIYLADTLGEMGLWYRLAPVVFVGGSFKPVGGHNPLEPARLGCAVLFGPEMFNFKEMASHFAEAGTESTVPDGKALGQRVALLLADSTLRQELADKAKDLALRETTVADRVMERLLPGLQETAV